MTKTKRRVRCDQCQLLRINGVVCHETGCPDAYKSEVRECKECPRLFKPKERHQTCCSKSCFKMYHH